MADSINTSIQLESDCKKELFPLEMRGQENLSDLPEFDLIALSESSDVQTEDVLGKTFTLVVKFNNADQEGERRYGGYCVQMIRGGKIGRYFSYGLTLRPWFWMLTKRTNSRVFQKLTTPKIIKKIFEDYSIVVVDDAGLKENYKERRYCIQYNESDFNFLSRLMEEEGIYYWFEYDGAKQKLMLADGPVPHKELKLGATMNYVDDYTSNARGNEITSWFGAARHYSGKHASADYDFKKSKVKLGVEIAFEGKFDESKYEVFEYPGNYLENADGEKLAKVRAIELSLPDYHAFCSTSWPDVKVGELFKLDRHGDKAENTEYLIIGGAFNIWHAGYEGMDWSSYAKTREADHFRFVNRTVGQWPGSEKLMALIGAGQIGRSISCDIHLRVIPSDPGYRPIRKTPKTVMPGPQTAVVVGPKGKEIYTDEFGRVKVQFHWDRKGKKDENSSCFVRVSKPWAGKGWGGYFIPRIGQEVIVEFMEGDPDRPVVTGRLYNDDQEIPYETPTQSGFKTRSTPGGGVENFNEIMFEDKIGEELFSMHAERDMATSVERDDSTVVDRDQTLAVKRDHTTSVTRDRSVTVMRNETKMVNVDQKNTVKGKQNNQVVGDRVTFADATDTLTVTGASTHTVVGARSDISKAGETRHVTGNQSVTVTGNITYKAAKMSFEAAHIDWLVTGASSKYITVPTGPLHLMANKIKLMSNTGIEMMSVGSIDATSVGSNTTVLGPNSSGYIGFNSECTMGISRSTFMGMNMENTLAIAISNFAGVSIENTLGVKLVNCAAPEIETMAVNVDLSPLHTFSPGVGAGAVAGAAVAGVLGAVAGAAGAWADVKATLKQYADAAKALDTASKEARAAGLPGLADRLSQLAGVTRNRRIEGILGAIPGVGTVAMVAAEGLVAYEASEAPEGSNTWKTAGEKLADDQSRNADGSAAPPAPPPPPPPAWPWSDDPDEDPEPTQEWTPTPPKK